ncbi:MAG: sensor histidine kinase [Ignavibacteriales bacterium]|nr:sensor histidine kinase [Ignavibacteriales bacterium]
MKLWIKLAIILFVVTNVIIEIVLFVVKPQVKEHYLTLLGEKLKSTASASAVAINGDEFKQLNFFDSSIHNNSSFLHIRNQLSKTKSNLGLKEDVYTLSLIDSDAAIFGVTTNPNSYTGDTLHLINAIPKNALSEAYNHNKCIYTSLYEDQYGTWISGLAPIMDSAGKVVGVVQVDNSLSTVQALLSQIDNSILWVQIIFVPFTILLSIAIAMFFTKPIKEVTKRINKLALGDYSVNIKTKSSGEINEIYKAAENLRATILEQQDKIFHTVTNLRDAKDKAEATSRMKSEFLAMISHEIRTPLNIILGGLEVVKYELDDERLKEVEDVIVSVKLGSERLIRTVEMIVLYSELASGSYNVNEKPININKLFFNQVEKFKRDAESNNVTLKTDCATSISVVKIDERLLEESLSQVINNAIKFTKGGEVKFCIIDSKEFGIAILIEDNGIGISEGFMKELFKPFRQEDMTIARGFEGNGLGLALAKKCSDANGVKMTVQSEKKKGTTVEFHIPKEKIFDL